MAIVYLVMKTEPGSALVIELCGAADSLSEAEARMRDEKSQSSWMDYQVIELDTSAYGGGKIVATTVAVGA